VAAVSRAMAESEAALRAEIAAAAAEPPPVRAAAKTHAARRDSLAAATQRGSAGRLCRYAAASASAELARHLRRGRNFHAAA
jgi:hypothetical protein